jgi:hypothetical protein
MTTCTASHARIPSAIAGGRWVVITGAVLSATACTFVPESWHNAVSSPASGGTPVTLVYELGREQPAAIVDLRTADDMRWLERERPEHLRKIDVVVRALGNADEVMALGARESWLGATLVENHLATAWPWPMADGTRMYVRSGSTYLTTFPAQRDIDLSLDGTTYRFRMIDDGRESRVLVVAH